MFIWDAYRGCQFTKILHIKYYSTTPLFLRRMNGTKYSFVQYFICYNKFQLNICFSNFQAKRLKNFINQKKPKEKKNENHSQSIKKPSTSI